MKMTYKIMLFFLAFGTLTSVQAQEKVSQQSIDKIKSLLVQQTSQNGQQLTATGRPAAIVVTPGSERWVDPSTINGQLSLNSGEKSKRPAPIQADLVTGSRYHAVKEKLMKKAPKN